MIVLQLLRAERAAALLGNCICRTQRTRLKVSKMAVDTEVDRRLGNMAKQANGNDRAAELDPLRGQAALC
jgi:hypothetical protein